MTRSLTLTLALLGTLPNTSTAQEATTRITYEKERDARMRWWRDAKFGMFIHWGVYAVPAGVYQNRPVPGIGEWIMLRGKIPVAEYKAYAKQFDPTEFDADAWVRLAKNAGMKYIVITAKHHDGFAMYPSKVNAWNLHDATPFKRDPLQELAEACRKHGIKLGFYYSQAQDWINGGAAAGGKWDPAQERDMDEYVDKVAIPQVKELLTNYAEFPSILWWDTPGRAPNFNINQAQAERLHKVAKALRPDLILNDRLGGNFEGDTVTPEQRIPPEGYPGKDWETCMTMNGTWGFKRDDENWKSTAILVRNLCDIASKGGNYLLNVGPTAEGVIPEASVQRLKEVGDWMKANGEALYGSAGSPFHQVHGTYDPAKLDRQGKPTFTPTWDWRCTSKPGKLYLMIFDWPKDGAFTLPGLESKVTRASLLVGLKDIEFAQRADGVTLTLPKDVPDPIASVVCLEIADANARVVGADETSGK